MELTQELVKELFDYKDGFLYWKKRTSNRIFIGKKVDAKRKSINGDRYIVRFNNVLHACSRIIFLWHHGYLPVVVDHKDRNQLNDNIDNLRSATFSTNAMNQTKIKGTSSKYIGVSLHRWNRWSAKIRINGKSKHLGCFINEAEAAIAYNNAAKIHHGEFANINIIE